MMTPLKNKHKTKNTLCSIKTFDYKHVSYFCVQSTFPKHLLFVEAAGCDVGDESEKAGKNWLGSRNVPSYHVSGFLPPCPTTLHIPLKFWYYMGHNCLYTPYFNPIEPSGECLQSHMFQHNTFGSCL